MREPAFIKQNLEAWEQFELLLKDHSKTTPDVLADLFVRITNDLSFSRTQYPNSQTTTYLNDLASKAHHAIYRNKKEKTSRFITFWTQELPLVFRAAHKQFLYSFIFFALAMLIGAVSAANDETFVRLIMGDGYVNMTLENIEKGEPLGVYGSMGQMNMFFQITINNIMVSLRVFAAGILLSIGTVFMLFFNGVMLGSFQYFFYQEGLLMTSFLTIWIHGTLEISAIIIAGGAGLVIGNSILFPGTYSRIESFKKGAKEGLKIVIGLIPVFIMAGFLESFVTRWYAQMHWSIKTGIIVASAAFIIYYFILLPIKIEKNARNKDHQFS